MKRHWLTFFIAVMLTAVCGGMGAYFTYGVVRQAGTTNWPSVQGTITLSEVRSHRGSKGGRTYHPEVQYTYSVNNTTHQGDGVTLAGGFDDSGGGYARRTVAEFPAGKQVPVYYNPQSPEESVLRRGIGEREWQIVGLAGLVLSAPLIAWSVFISGLMTTGGRVGTVRVMEPAPGVSVIRNLLVSALTAGMIGWGVGQVGTLIVVLGFMDEHAREGVFIGWGAAAALAVCGYVLRRRWIAAGRRDHVIDRNSGVFIPARGASSAAESLPLATITDTRVLQDSNISTNKRQHYRVHLVITGREKTLPLVDISRKEDAETFDGWLRERLRLGRDI